MEVEIFKFGGGIVKDPQSIEQVLIALRAQEPHSRKVLVFSAFGKNTDTLLAYSKANREGNEKDKAFYIEKFYAFHKEIAAELFPSKHPIFLELEDCVKHLRDPEKFLFHGKQNMPEAFYHDQALPKGELMASKIMSEYFRQEGVKNTFLDASRYVVTDNNFGNASVFQSVTRCKIRTKLSKMNSKPGDIIVTQGYIAHSENYFLTTLGREGSDYSAGLFGYALDARAVHLFKNVPGIMDKDPNIPGNEDARVYDFLTYEDCRALLNGPAKGVVHGSTIDIVQKSNKPLYVRPFDNLVSLGTLVASAMPTNEVEE